MLFLTFSALVARKKTTLYGGQSRSWPAEQGKKKKEKKVWQRPPPPCAARPEKINKIDGHSWVRKTPLFREVEKDIDKR